MILFLRYVGLYINFVHNGSVGAGIFLIEVWKSVQETSTSLFRVVSGEIDYIYLFSNVLRTLLYHQNTEYLP